MVFKVGSERLDYEPLDIPLDPASVTKEQMNEARRQAVELLRSHFWSSQSPPYRGGKKRTVAAELGIWNKLAKAHGPVQVNGAISVTREALGIPGTDTITMLLFYGAGRRHWLNRCIQHWEKKRARDGGTARAGAILRQIMEGK